MDDFVEGLGRAYLAHRIQRLTGSLLDGGEQWLSTVGVSAPADATSILMLIRNRGPMPPKAIAATLQIANSLASGLCRELVRQGLACREPAGLDRRVWPISLTFEGRKEAERVATAGRVVAAVYEQLFDEIGTDMFKAVEALEAALSAIPLSERLAAYAERRPPRLQRRVMRTDPTLMG